MSAKPSLRFYHAAPLRRRADKVLTAIAQDDDPTRHSGELAELVVDLTQEGMDYYFLRPIRQAKLGLVAQKASSYGVSAAVRLMSPMVRSILRGANAAQLRTIAEHMRHLQGDD